MNRKKNKRKKEKKTSQPVDQWQELACARCVSSFPVLVRRKHSGWRQGTVPPRNDAAYVKMVVMTAGLGALVEGGGQLSRSEFLLFVLGHHWPLQRNPCKKNWQVQDFQCALVDSKAIQVNMRCAESRFFSHPAEWRLEPPPPSRGTPSL